MSDLHQVLIERTEDFRPARVPPFQALQARKRARDRRRGAAAVAAAGSAVAAIAFLPTVLGFGGDRQDGPPSIAEGGPEAAVFAYHVRADDVAAFRAGGPDAVTDVEVCLQYPGLSDGARLGSDPAQYQGRVVGQEQAEAFVACVERVPGMAATLTPADAKAGSDKSALYVAEGDRIAGSGVVVSDGREARMCGGRMNAGGSRPVTYPSTPCRDGVLLRDFSTRDLVEAGSVLAGDAAISGVWRDGGVDVTSQSPVEQLDPWTTGFGTSGFDSSKVPCAEPAAGWSDEQSFPQHDYPPPLLTLREQHPADVLGTAVLTPTEQHRVLGVVAADADAATRITEALTPTYGSSICVVVSPYTAADYQQAARGAPGVLMVGQPEFGAEMTMVVSWSALIVDDIVQAALDGLPDGLVRVNSVLKPVAAEAG